MDAMLAEKCPQGHRIKFAAIVRLKSNDRKTKLCVDISTKDSQQREYIGFAARGTCPCIMSKVIKQK
jgi:hypothetical protein